jgi:hypothetical protein
MFGNMSGKVKVFPRKCKESNSCGNGRSDGGESYLSKRLTKEGSVMGGYSVWKMEGKVSSLLLAVMQSYSVFE